MDITFEYCALQFIAKWSARENELWIRLRGTPTGSDVQKALRYFQVARGFPNLSNVRRAGAISRLLITAGVDEKLTSSQKVIWLAKQFKKHYGNKNISAATKLLWLRHRRPFVIYDSRSRRALDLPPASSPSGSYEAYVEKWQAEFQVFRSPILEACSQLSRLGKFLPPGVTAAMADRWSKSKWFHERVFDHYLWEMGGQSK